MLPPRTNRRSVIVWIFLASCAISLLSSLFFYAYFGREAGAVFFQPGRVFTRLLSDGVAAVLLLAILLPLRSVGSGPFWACGFGAVVILWPPLGDQVSALLDLAGRALTSGQPQAPAPATETAHEWFYCLLNFPDNLVLVTGSILLLAVVDRLWPVPPPTGAGVAGGYPRSAPGRGAKLSVAEILFSFDSRLNRRPAIIGALSVGIPNSILQALVPADVGLLLQAVLLWPLLALGTKRAHDRDHGTEWVVCMLALPAACGILLEIVVAAHAPTGGLDVATLNLITALDLLIVLPVLWASIELVFLRGTPGANRYGPDSLGGGGERRASVSFGEGVRPAAAMMKPPAPFPPHVTPEAAARFRQRFRRK